MELPVCYSTDTALRLTQEIKMKVFLVAIMALIYNGDEKDIYIWSNPYFQSMQECKVWVKENNFDIYNHLRKEFPGDQLERLLCVEEDKLREFLQQSQTEQGAKI